MKPYSNLRRATGLIPMSKHCYVLFSKFSSANPRFLENIACTADQSAPLYRLESQLFSFLYVHQCHKTTLDNRHRLDCRILKLRVVVCYPTVHLHCQHCSANVAMNMTKRIGPAALRTHVPMLIAVYAKQKDLLRSASKNKIDIVAPFVQCFRIRLLKK